jgi:hypothetical protein
MTWTLERLTRAGFTERLSDEGKEKLATILTDGTWENWIPANSPVTPFTLFNEEYRQELTAKWAKSGLLENIPEGLPQFYMAQLFENQASQLKWMETEERSSLTQAEKQLWQGIALPLVYRAFSTVVQLPCFSVVATPAAFDKWERPIVVVARQLKAVAYPDRIEFYSGIDHEAEVCQLLGEYFKSEISAHVMENTLSGRDTYWYLPFSAPYVITDPETNVRRLGFITRYAASSNEKPNDN